jgi:hypothetical protein
MKQLFELLKDRYRASLKLSPPAKYSEDRRSQACYSVYNWNIGSRITSENKQPLDERSPELTSDLEAQPDDLGKDPSQIGAQSAGQTASAFGLSHEAEAAEDSVEDLADTDPAVEAAAVEGVEDAADHPERPTHTHDEYGRPNDAPPRNRDDEAA